MVIVKRKMWINILTGKLNFEQIKKVAENNNLEIIKMFKPDMMVDIHMGVKGRKEDIENFKSRLILKGHEILNRCPRRSFKFEI